MKDRSYNSKEGMVYMITALPYALIINLIIFGRCLVSNAAGFFEILGCTVVYYTLVYALCGIVATMVQNRYPDENSMLRRTAIMLPIFYTMQIITVQLLFFFYEKVSFGCPPLRQNEWWVTGFSFLGSTIITVVNEAAAGWDNWKQSLVETEQLKSTYNKTRLLGLKGQVNPHFLFNCFNSLSSLIQDDPAGAEKFLDEMTKVHRYMLRSDEEQIVSLQQEIGFAQSYMHLIKARFGNAVQLQMDCGTENLQAMLPALSLQAVLENTIYTNIATKQQPLQITISCQSGHVLQVKHSLQPKSTNSLEEDDALDNLVRKYQLLHGDNVSVIENKHERKIMLPLIMNKTAADETV